MKIIVDSTTDIGLNLQSTKSLASPLLLPGTWGHCPQEIRNESQEISLKNQVLGKELSWQQITGEENRKYLSEETGILFDYLMKWRLKERHYYPAENGL